MTGLRTAALLVLGVLAAAPIPSASAEDQRTPTAEELANANNPLAKMKALNLQNYYRPTLYGLPDEISNTFWLRFASGMGRWFVRVSAPISTVPPNDADNTSGLGDIDAFAAYTFVATPARTFGVGPLLVAPTAGEDPLGTGKWQAGLAAVFYGTFSPVVQGGGLLTWQGSIGGDDDRSDTSLLVLQNFWFFQMGGGTYLRSSPVWTFDLENDVYTVPFGLGIGRVTRAEKIVFNMFIEPQWTIWHEGVGQPALQIFAAINMQFVNN